MKNKKMKKADGFVVAVVASDSDNRKKYRIRETEAGLVCPCLAFRFARGHVGSRTKVCKHIERMAM